MESDRMSSGSIERRASRVGEDGGWGQASRIGGVDDWGIGSRVGGVDDWG